MNRRNIAHVADAMAKAPSQEIPHCFRIGAPRMRVADIGREKFQKAHVHTRRRLRADQRQGERGQWIDGSMKSDRVHIYVEKVEIALVSRPMNGCKSIVSDAERMK